MKHIQRITAAALSVLLSGSIAVPAYAGAASSKKEEVIYVMTDASGSVTDIEAVNIFAGGDITDYGDYSSVKMLNTDDAITQDGDRITFSSDASRVYYQGTMKDTDIPWDISIRYYLDGKEYTADELAGRSGALEIRFRVSRNGDCSGTGTLSSSVGELNDAVKELYDGTGELRDGTSEFFGRTADIDTEISDGSTP